MTYPWLNYPWLNYPWVLVGLHLVCAGLAGWAWGIERRRYREAMTRHMVRVLRRDFAGISDIERMVRPKRTHFWTVFMAVVAPTDVMLLWGWIEGALRHG